MAKKVHIFRFFPPPPCPIATHSRLVTNAHSLFCVVMIDVDGKPLPPLPVPEYGLHQYGPLPTGMTPPVMVPILNPEYDDYGDDGEYYHPDDYSSPEYAMESNRLSTITERTERSEYSKHYPSARQVAYRDSISSNTEYEAFRGAYRNLHGRVVCSCSSPQNRDSLQPPLRLHSLYPSILIRSHLHPRRNNGMPWDWKCRHRVTTLLPHNHTTISRRNAPLPL